ncbi:hypothetical protein [Bradyrhizobium sp. Gha]|uniref:hypothetical protein n=1 Tax=Bradyrhizobium sp. Gha TaxID=1855318 RepID=UPI0015A55F8B|nr:hypothetical protein [Bradyrhizobium sp. Gha]
MAGASSYILFAAKGCEFAMDCPTGAIYGRCEGDGVEFTCDGSDEMERARGRGWAEELADGSLEGEICLEGGDDIPVIARRLVTSSTACLRSARGKGTAAVANGYCQRRKQDSFIR